MDCNGYYSEKHGGTILKCESCGRNFVYEEAVKDFDIMHVPGCYNYLYPCDSLCLLCAERLLYEEDDED